MDSVDGKVPIGPRGNILIEAKERVRESVAPLPKKEALSGAFFWLSAFYFVYCARPEDWIPGLDVVPLAKITAIAAMVALFSSWGKTPRRFKNLPREASYLLIIVGLLFASAFVSPIWRGGA